jgi:hypothetical protein
MNRLSVERHSIPNALPFGAGMTGTRTQPAAKLETSGRSGAGATRRILRRITCPHCWEQFAPERVLWISEHSDLLGDPRLGPEHQQRFLPTRFTVAGEAIDGKGFPCHSLACPKCHLNVPSALLEMEPLFFSIFGAPASGKSFFLAAMAWELRKTLPLTFSIAFSDADPVSNRHLHEYEESLFSSGSPKSLVPLGSLIRKTEEQGDLYDTVAFGTQTVSYPRPLLFALQPSPEHPNAEKLDHLSKVLCLYDNAGESFLPGKDTAANPVTRHIAQSRVLFFVFDPTQDSRFQLQQDGHRLMRQSPRTFRQEPILQEAAARIRRYAGIPQTHKHQRPLIVILTKFDEWSQLLGSAPPPSPWMAVDIPRQSKPGSSRRVHALDSAIVERQSRHAREALLELTPEIVTAAEGFASEVIYIPVSAVGWKTEWSESNRQLAIRPVDTEPHWATVPFVYALSRSTPGLIPQIARKSKDH